MLFTEFKPVKLPRHRNLALKLAADTENGIPFARKTKSRKRANVNFSPIDFATPEYAQRVSISFDEYIKLRVIGIPRHIAIMEAFELVRYGISTDNADALGMAADCNPYVKERYTAALASKDVKRDLWSLNEAVNQLLRIVKNPSERGATRLNAIGQLNLLCGYVEVDDATKRRIGHTLADFQKLDANWQAGGEGGSPVH